MFCFVVTSVGSDEKACGGLTIVVVVKVYESEKHQVRGKRGLLRAEG